MNMRLFPTCLLWLVSSLTTFIPVTPQVFNEPAGQRRSQTYRVLEFENGNINQRFDGTLRYYCTFRGKWSEKRHPKDFPRSASWSAPVILSHSNGYRMWTGTETATLGVESLAEVSEKLLLSRVRVRVRVQGLFLLLSARMK
jgi:hypothetical protein